MDPDTQIGELGHSAADVHGVAAEAVELGDHQHVPGLKSIEKTNETSALACRDIPGDRFVDHAPRLDLEASSLDFLQLIIGGLAGGGHANVSESACHGQILSEIGARNYPYVRNYVALDSGQTTTMRPETNDSVHGPNGLSAAMTGNPGLRRLIITEALFPHQVPSYLTRKLVAVSPSIRY